MPTPPQNPLTPDDTLYFLHIPKTAGTSFRTFLEDHFDLDVICPHLLLEELLARPPSELARYRLISGHHGWFLHRLVHTPLTIATILRDPVARTISHFYHQRNTRDTWVHDIVRDWTFEQYVFHPLGISEIANFQMRYLTLDRVQEDYWDHSALRDREIEALEAKYTDPRSLDTALSRLEEFAFVGLVERFDDAVRLAAHRFGWPSVGAPPRLNPRRSQRDPADLTEKALAQVRRLTKLDQKLYDHAKRRFEADVDALNPDAAERAYSASMRDRPRVNDLRLGFERGIHGEGWHPRSRKSEGPVNRWTGPGTTATIDAPLATGGDLKIVFHAGAYKPEVLRSIRCTVNGEPVALTSWQTRYAGDTDGVFSGVIPRAVLARNDAYTRVQFEVSGTIRPSDVDPNSKDTRQLGLHFRWLEVFPA